MKLFKTAEVKMVDRLTMEYEPISSPDLMERAAQQLLVAMRPQLSLVDKIVVLAGKGNNGGDALIMARELKVEGYKVETYTPKGNKSTDHQIAADKYTLRTGEKPADIESYEPQPSDIIIDGLFGTGLNRPLEGIYASIIEKINGCGCKVLAIDLPSGLFGEDNSGNRPQSILKAHHTYTIGAPKISMLLAENASYVGDWTLIDIQHHPLAIAETPTIYHYTTETECRQWIRPRTKYSHKGTYGHGLLIAGSYGMMGAAQLAAKAALRTGCGLLTTHIPQKGYEIMQIGVPEAIVSLDCNEKVYSTPPQNKERYSAIAIGPGLGKAAESLNGFRQLLKEWNGRLIIDADAINLLAENKDLWQEIPEGSILTPHPKEFERLAGKCTNGFEKLERQREISQKQGVIIVLKGAHTSISLPDGSIHFNSSGNPCLATAGSGDVLTGILLSLLAQGYEPSIAARLGVWIHGKAADDYQKETGKEIMLASDICEWILR